MPGQSQFLQTRTWSAGAGMVSAQLNIHRDQSEPRSDQTRVRRARWFDRTTSNSAEVTSLPQQPRLVINATSV